MALKSKLELNLLIIDLMGYGPTTKSESDRCWVSDVSVQFPVFDIPFWIKLFRIGIIFWVTCHSPEISVSCVEK